MADTSIKIISNPYTERVEFLTFKDNEWHPIAETNPNSALLSEDISRGFLPFKAARIAELIAKEYATVANAAQIIFEGPSDEYDELVAACDDEKIAGKIKLSAGERYLPNARDVLPDIIEVFTETVEPLAREIADKNDDIEHDLKKFTDASSDAIPLCVVGNYSAGKSTFINALIGQELLPNGDQPVTAKIFKIKRSHQQDRGEISFEYGDTKIHLQFGNTGLIEPSDCSELEPCEEIAKACSETKEAGLIAHMSEALSVLNRFKTVEDGPNISDLIEIVTPFCDDDAWGQTRDFVIFDTPGSNSATNKDHLRVLQKAMDGLSNGLPIFVAEHRTLDSTDNEKLYGLIGSIDAMDERFAMIIVNRADEADLPEKEFSEEGANDILEKAIPKHLYAQGIYFVSSLIALGSKIDGEFRSYVGARVYSRTEQDFSDPDGRFYTQLYRYNIAPKQIRDRIVGESAQCENLILTNSGFYCVEREMELFAEKYSAYNKCGQSEGLLRRIVVATVEQIEEAKKKLEADVEARNQSLQEEKRELIHSLDAEGERIETSANDAYAAQMQLSVNAQKWLVDKSELQRDEQKLSDENRTQYEFDTRIREAETARQAVKDNFLSGLASVFEKPSVQALMDVAQQLESDRGDAAQKKEMLQKAKKDAENETSDELLGIIRQQFGDDIESIKSAVDEASKNYWEERSNLGREALRKLATGSEVLSEEKRRQIEQIIVQYPALVLSSDLDREFARSKFEKGFRIGELVVLRSTKLNLEKLARDYNKGIEEAVIAVKDAVSVDHKASFADWLGDLMSEIIGNIEDYNPTLHKYVEEIKRDRATIKSLEGKLEALKQGAADVTAMIDWKE